jgi:hypothetical protein
MGGASHDKEPLMQIHPVVRFATMMNGVTTDTSGSAIQVPSTGFKTFWAQVAGTGAVSVTVTIYGNLIPTTSNGVLLATFTLSGTSQAQDAAASITANYPYFYATTASITGTGATVAVHALY